MERIKQNISKVNGNVSAAFDLFRATAAILVLLTHLRDAMFVTYNDVVHKSKVLEIFFFLTSLGHQAVMVFFVLSGFFISLSVLKKLSDDKWSWKNYLSSRIARIYTVLIPALVLTFLLDHLGIQIFGLGSIYGHFYNNVHKNGVVTFIGNLFQLQDLYVPTFGTNDPLWSLNYEWWYYILFPLIILSLSKKVPLVKKLTNILLVILLFAVLGKAISLYFLIWLLGTIALILPGIHLKGFYKKLILVTLCLIFFLASLYISRSGTVGVQIQNILYQFKGDILVAISFSIIVYLTLHFVRKKEGNKKTIFQKTTKFFADFSFTLYLIHYPLIIFFEDVYKRFGGEKLQPTLVTIICFILIGLTTLLTAYVISLLTEAHTTKITNFLMRKSNNNELKKKNRIAS